MTILYLRIKRIITVIKYYILKLKEKIKCEIFN